MKNIRILLRSSLLFAILISLVFVTASAQPLLSATSKTLSTNFNLVNLGSEDAIVTAQYIKSDGSPWDADNANESFTIAKNYGQISIAQYFDQTLSSGAGSVVLSSSEPLGAIVQILARSPQTPTYGAYLGIDAPEAKYLAPQVFKNLNTANGLARSALVIQNTETASITVDVQLIPYPGIAGLVGYSNQFTIPGGTSYNYDLTEDAQIAAGWTGSAVITAQGDKKIAVVVNSFVGTNSLQTYNAFPASEASTDWAIPMFTSRLANKLSTPVTVQNVSDVEIAAEAIVLSCVPLSSEFGEPFTVKNQVAVPVNGGASFNPVADMSIPANWSGSCVVTSPSNVVVVTQMRRPGASEELGAYEAYPVSAAGSKIIVPQMSKHQPNGYATVFTVKNLDNTNEALVKLTYTPAAAYINAGGNPTPIVLNKTIPAGGSISQNLRFQEVTEIPDGWYGTLVVEPQLIDTARPLLGMLQLTNWAGAPGDTFMVVDTLIVK